MLERMPSSHLAAWQAYELLEPFGPRAEQQRAGVVAATIANANRNPKKRRQPFTAADFFPDRRPKRRASVQAIRAKAAALAAGPPGPKKKGGRQ